MRRFWFAAVTACFGLPAQELPDRFARTRELVMPSASELAWQAIPWRAEFGAAVVEAQRAHKPVLLWAMNGHPLGCT
jgi:hypothetical protein